MSLVFDPTGVGFYDTGTGALGLPQGTTAERPSAPQNGYTRYNTDLNAIESYVAGAWTLSSQGAYVINLLMVAGGGGGGTGAGGGAGGLIYTQLGTMLVSGTNYAVAVGAGGAGYNGAPNTPGGNTTFAGIIAYGGGGGTLFGGPFGSGGGGNPGTEGNFGNPIPGTLGQGNQGGLTYGYGAGYIRNWGGGGGAGGVGGNAGTGTYGAGGTGGVGLSINISGTGVYYAGGGGGSGYWSASSTPYTGGYSGPGGNGGGGPGSNQGTTATAGTSNTGGGGGGSSYYTNGGNWYTAGNGGSGILILSYLGAQRGTGGTVTTSGGYTIHTFTSSGTYTA